MLYIHKADYVLCVHTDIILAWSDLKPCPCLLKMHLKHTTMTGRQPVNTASNVIICHLCVPMNEATKFLTNTSINATSQDPNY